MKQGIARTAVLSLLGVPVLAQAAALGDIVLHSRIGEPLRAEVRLSGGSEIDTACFSLTAPPGNDLPAITNARLKLVREGTQRRLLISSNEPVNEPLFLLAVRAHCGVELQRDFALMPLAPPETRRPVSPPSLPVAPVVRSNDWVAGEGDTLEGIADLLAPDNTVQRKRALAALRRANPGLAPGMNIPPGTPITIPDPSALVAEAPAQRPAPPAKPAAKPQRKPEAPAPAKAAAKPAPAAPAPAPKPAAKPAPTDRIVLGNATDDLPPSAKAKETIAGNTPTPDNLRAMEERIVRMEATLQALNREIEQTNKVLELATEALTVQQKLRAAQAEQAQLAQITAKLPEPAAAPEKPAPANQWIELLLAAVLGGGMVAGLVTLLNRRRSVR